MKIFTKSVIVLFLIIGNTAVFAQKPAFKVVGYFPNWADMENDLKNLDCSKLTHINWAFVNPDSTGRLSGRENDLDKLVSKAHASGVKVMISLGGGSASGSLRSVYFNLISTESKRAGFIHKISDYLTQHQLQGVDVDLEGRAINSDYDPFIKQLSDTLKPKGLLLTAALNGDADDNLQNSTLAYFDWINIMSYDATGTWTPNNPGQHASYEYAESGIKKWTERGAKPEQLVLGLPFYGHAFRQLLKLDYYNYNQIIKLYPDAYSKDELGDVFYHNGIPTIQKKTKMAMEKIAGVMIWALTYDTYDQYSLLKAVDDVVKNHPSSAAGVK